MATRTIYLLPDYTLTFTADGTGAGSYLDIGNSNAAPTAINNNDVVVLGPFNYLKAFRLQTDTGSIAAEKAFQNNLGFGADGGTQSRQVNQDQLLRVLNSTGSALSAGQVVYVSGVTTGTPTVALAQADAEATSPAGLMILAEDIADTEYGFAVPSGGLVYDVDTSAFSAGDTLYLSGATAGPAHSIRENWKWLKY